MRLFLMLVTPAGADNLKALGIVPEGWRNHNVKITPSATRMPNTSVSSLYVNLFIIVSSFV
ncbi:MAG TPA: hypothetical protein VFZ52_06090 [Chryseolinea sp.]